MATSGYLATNAWTSNYGYTRYVELYWERISYDVINQTSTISWTFKGAGTFDGQVKSGPFAVYIDGMREYYDTSRISLYAGDVIASGIKVINHKSDGTKTFRITIEAAVYSSAINLTNGVDFELDIVGKARLITAPNFNDEENPTITYSNPVGNGMDGLHACISLTGASDDIAYRDISKTGTSYTFNLTDAERKVLRAATQGANSRKVFFYVRSVVDGTSYYDYEEITFTVINANPTIAATVIDTNAETVALTGNNETLIRYHSTAYASYTATAYKEATIKTYVIEHNGGLTSNNTLTVPNVNGNTFAFISADSRGNTASETIVAPMIDYIRPTANIDASQRMDTTGYYNLKVSGNYYNDTFGYTDAAAANTLTLHFRYKTQSGSYGSWEQIAPQLDGNTYSAQAFINGLDYRTAYVFQVRIVDSLNTVYSAEMTVRSLPVFHWSETDFVFEVPVSFNAGTNGATAAAASDTGNDFGGDVNITGDLRLKGSGNYGNTLYFGDGSYAYIREATDDDLTIKAADINIDGELYLNGSQIHYGSWTPSLSSSGAVSSYSIQQGWFQRVGNVVSVGWQIKATINSGYNTTNVVISGLPYTPSYAAFGGGIAHNIYLTGGFCFEGYAAGTDGNITLRGQPCNNTSAANLNITSSAYYPTGSGNVMTLGGTITYFTNS